MALKLTDTIADTLALPEKGNKIAYDTEVKGFGCRVTAAGARSFILNYRTRSGRERRYTIGSRPDWKTSAAREEAKELKRRIDRGEDPMAAVEADRNAKTVAALCQDYIEKHLPKKRAASAADDKAMIRDYVLPKLKHLKVAEVTFPDIDGLHRAITKQGKPYRANRVVSLLSKMFALALKWQWRDYAAGNPCIGIERNQEEKRDRYLSPAELTRFTTGLAAHEDQQACNIIRLLLLTGARRNEVCAMRWSHLDLAIGTWTKPGSATKQNKLHHAPLSAPARQLLAGLRAQAEREATKEQREVREYVFPGRSGTGHRHGGTLKRLWYKLCLDAELGEIRTVKDAKGKERHIFEPNVRIHDLRHTYASLLASSGLSLPVIGALLGHSQQATTARYAHLMLDPLRQATERVGAIVMPPQDESGEIVPIKGGAA